MTDLPDLNKPVFKVFPEAKKNVQAQLCATCGKHVGEFKDRLSKKEYSISGMCQVCQDRIFN